MNDSVRPSLLLTQCSQQLFIVGQLLRAYAVGALVKLQKPFGRLHPRLRFPHISLLVMGFVTAIACFLTLTTIINALIALTLFTQFIAQIAALTILRRKQPGLKRPYKQWLYPLPSIVALAGWIYIFQASGWAAIRVAIIWTVLGIIAFAIWARVEHVWPFGPKEIREEFLNPAQEKPEVLS